MRFGILLQAGVLTKILSDFAKGDLTSVRAELADLTISLALALLTIAAAIVVAKLTRKGLRRALDRGRVSKDPLLRDFFLRVTSISISSVGVLLALTQVGFDVPTFVAGLGITGIILGFGFKDVLSNFAAGLLLLIYRPFRAGEIVDVEGTQGTVTELTIVNMHMTTTDGVCVIMPNSKVWGAKIVNYSLSERRRLELTLKVRTDDVHQAIAAIKAALDKDERILETPEPALRVTGIAGDTAALSILVWTKPEDYAAVSADEYLRLLSEFNDNDLHLL